jgi:hypothetical protein
MLGDKVAVIEVLKSSIEVNNCCSNVQFERARGSGKIPAFGSITGFEEVPTQTLGVGIIRAVVKLLPGEG